MGQHGVGAEDEEEVGEVRDSHPEVSRGVLIQTISQLEIVTGQKVINDSEQAPTKFIILSSLTLSRLLKNLYDPLEPSEIALKTHTRHHTLFELLAYRRTKLERLTACCVSLDAKCTKMNKRMERLDLS